MIATLLRIFWIHLRRDRVVWVLTFIVPVAFYSVFAIIFSGSTKSNRPAVRVAVVDEDDSEFSRKLVASLENEKCLRVVTTQDPEDGTTPRALRRAEAESRVREGKDSAAVIIPKGLGACFGDFSAERPTIEVLADSSDPVMSEMLAGMLQGLAMTSAPDTMFKGGISAGLLNVKTVDLLGEEKANPVVAFYAAATGVMFLLFSCSNGAGGTLLEEVENGTLDRLLSSRLTMTQLIVGKWLSYTLLGVMQLTVMFVWGWMMFQLELWTHLAGFIVMTVVTAAAASAFGLVLGTLCRTRGQLSGLSTTAILLMSAVGGSMFPRFMMSDTLKNIGLATFNAWALDGYQKVFWRDLPVWQLWPQLLVLLALAAAFLTLSRWLARRWEVV